MTATLQQHLSESMGHLFKDHSLWNDSRPTNSFSISTWIERSGLASVAKTCNEELKVMFETSFNAGDVHGSAFMGSSVVCAFRLATDKQS